MAIPDPQPKTGAQTIFSDEYHLQSVELSRLASHTDLRIDSPRALAFRKLPQSFEMHDSTVINNSAILAGVANEHRISQIVDAFTECMFE